MSNFRKTPLYHGEYFVALTIPKTEDPNIVPCDAKVNADGSFRFVFNVLYTDKDIAFAYNQARSALADHPTWKASLYRADRENRDSIFQSNIPPPRGDN